MKLFDWQGYSKERGPSERVLVIDTLPDSMDLDLVDMDSFSRVTALDPLGKIKEAMACKVTR